METRRKTASGSKRTTLTARPACLLILSALFATAVTPLNFAQQVKSSSKRKIVAQIRPNYPALALKLRIVGKVRMVAVVSPAGNVVGTEVLGGHPVLVQAAVDALAKFKWKPEAQETKETVVIQFQQSTDE